MHQFNIVRQAAAFVRRRLSHDATGHDWWHIKRVRENARFINKTEKADPFIVDLAAILHDVGDRKVIHANKNDYTIARHFLEQHHLSSEATTRVMLVIENISFSESLGKNNAPSSRELAVVQDADRLDAMGAIGIARAFAYGGHASRLIYDPTDTVKTPPTAAAYRRRQTSTLHHFEEKLFHLKDLMNTRAARQIAIRRHRFMKLFVAQFLAEWNGR